MKSFHEKKKFELVKFPKGKRALKKWVFKVKHGEHNRQPHLRASLFMKGFGKRKSIDEIFSLLVQITSIGTVLGLATIINLEVEKLDVTNSFLHGDLEEETCMDDAKEVSCTLANHFMLISKLSPPTEEKAEMDTVSCTSVVRSLMYVMVCTGSDIAHTDRVFIQFLSKLGNKLCEAVRWILIYLQDDTRRSTTGYLITLLGEQYGGSQDYTTVELFPHERLSTLRQRNRVRRCYG